VQKWGDIPFSEAFLIIDWVFSSGKENETSSFQIMLLEIILSSLSSQLKPTKDKKNQRK
jgi:hypothetical protein